MIHQSEARSSVKPPEKQKLAHDSFAIAFLGVVLALIGIFLALGQHRVDQPSQLVGDGGQSSGLGGATGDLFGLASYHFAAGDHGARAM